MLESHLRASDTDRETVARVLGEHMSAGRLTIEEYDERLTHAFAARTYGDLAELTADLPTPYAGHHPPLHAHVPDGPGASHAGQLPASAQPGAVVGCGSGGGSHDLAQAWRSWRNASAIVLAIWVILSLAAGPGYFWPVWVIGPWGAVLLVQTVAGRGRDQERRAIGR